MEFSNQEFYEGRLSSDPSVCYRSILDWETPILWIDTSTLSSCERNDNEQVDYKESEDGTSHMNPAEAKLAMQTLKDYFLHIGKQRILEEKIDVGVISPYKSQVRLLRHLLYKDPFWKPYRSLLSINTVDGFQGQERDIILISLVRSNEEGQIGFLHDLRRMNVAITRARMKLFLIGNKQTLCCHPFYKRLAEYVENVNKNEG